MRTVRCRYVVGLSAAGLVRFEGMHQTAGGIAGKGRKEEVAVEVPVQFLVELGDALRANPDAPGHAVWHLGALGGMLELEGRRPPRPAPCSSCGVKP